MAEPRRIAVLTSGGDAPGMNAAIRAVVRSGLAAGLEVVGVRRGYRGLLEGDFIPMPAASVSGIVHRGGTILMSARSDEFKAEQGMRRAADNLRAQRIDALIVIGGSGTARGAHGLCQSQGVPVILVPSSIDNDLGGTDYSIGFDTAVDTAVECIDRIRDTATSIERIFVVEVMGRDRGFIALAAGLAAGAECIIVPEVPYRADCVTKIIETGRARGKNSYIIVAAEGAAKGDQVAEDIRKVIDAQVRVSVLGYLQRGGNPTAFDRILGSRLGAAAVQAALDGKAGQMVCLKNVAIETAPIDSVWTQEKVLDTSLLELAARLAM